MGDAKSPHVCVPADLVDSPAYFGEPPRNTCTTAERTSNTRKTKNNVRAMSEAAPAMPVKPKTAATRAMTRKVRTQWSIR